MNDWKSTLRSDPTEWLLLNSSPPIQYRLLTEVHSLSASDANVARLRKSLLDYPEVKQLLRLHRKDGTWGGKMASSDDRKAERNTQQCMESLLELGLDRSFKEIRTAAKHLRRLLATSKETELFEFKKPSKDDPARQRFYRVYLRSVALALLARAGYRDDQKVIDGILAFLENTAAFVADPISRDPTEAVGTSLAQFRSEVFRDGYVYIPDRTLLALLAACPELLASTLHKNRLKRIFDYVLSPDYQALCPDLGAVRTARGVFPRGHGIALHDVETYLKEARAEEMLIHLEYFSRLGLVNRYPLLMAQMEWLLSQQEKDGRWNLPVKYFGARPRYMRLLRLEKDWKSPNRKVADLTFRVLLIVRHQWERQVKMLDRGEDLYPV